MRIKNDKIVLSHGNGGNIWHELESELSYLFSDGQFTRDAAEIGTIKNCAFTTDSYVVNPIFFSNKNIGDLAVSGTVNDLLTARAKPLFITCSLIIEEGFSFHELKTVLTSMAQTAKKAEVKIVTGDTKVVEKGKADKIYINTAGVGDILSGEAKNSVNLGDKVILSGTVGDHGTAVLLSRHNLPFNADIGSDAAPLTSMILPLIEEDIPISVMRDPTRGGLNSTLIELCSQYNADIVIDKEAVPVNSAVKGATEILGLDPFYLANEGKMIIIAPDNFADKTVEILNKSDLGKEAKVIGTVTAKNSFGGQLYIKTAFSSYKAKLLDLEELPRIC